MGTASKGRKHGKAEREAVGVDAMRDKLGSYINRAAVDGDRFVITRHGLPAAAIVSIDDLKYLEEREVA